MDDYHGTVTSKLKPIVTMLTEALVRDFCPAYRKFDNELWLRTGEDGHQVFVNEQQLWEDVEAWLMRLEEDVESETDRVFAKMVVKMIRRNKGWVTLLTNRVKARIS